MVRNAVVIIISGLVFLFSCSGDSPMPSNRIPPGNNSNDSPKRNSPPSYAVYSTGWIDVNAVVWRNGIPTILPSSSGIAEPTAIALNKDDIYVAGILFEQTNRAVYWKNGTMVKLTDDESVSEAWTIAVSGADVYVGGGFFNKAAYWKNGELRIVQLPPGREESLVSSIFVSGGDLYVLAGRFLYKNDVAIDLSPLIQSTSVIVSGSDILVAGAVGEGTRHVSAYWKNGEITKLSEGSSATGIAVAGSDIYVTGYSHKNTTKCWLWKNGVSTMLSDNGFPTSISVIDNDVYVAGVIVQSSGVVAATYWRNGVPSPLYAPTSRGRSYRGIARSIIALR